jgi:homoserine kinase
MIGGMNLFPQALLPEMVRLPVPKGVRAVLVHPELQVNTAQARRKLARGYTMDQWLEQQAYFGGFIAACAANNIDLIR